MPRDCFIEYKNKRGLGPITGTGCAHWVAHQRGGPMGQPNACQDGFKYRVVDVLATLVFNGHNTISHTSTTRSAGVLGDLETAVSRVVSVEVENDSSAAGEVVIQTKTNGSIYR